MEINRNLFTNKHKCPNILNNKIFQGIIIFFVIILFVFFLAALANIVSKDSPVYYKAWLVRKFSLPSGLAY